MKLKTFATAVLWAAAGGASASLLKDGFTPGTPSDLLVAVYDDSTGLASSGKTFLFNTHLSYGDFANGVISGKTIDLSADPNFQALKVSGARLKFNIVGGYSLADDFSNYDKTGSSGKIFTDKASTQWGLVTTGKQAGNFNGEFGNLSDTTKNRIFAYWSAANVKLTAAGATKTGGPDSVLVPPGDPQASFDLAWGGNFGGGGTANLATANLAALGESVKFYWITNIDFDKGSVIELGTWTLGEDGKLVYAGGGSGGNSNRAPVAKAGANQSVSTGAVVTLDGSGSSDPDGDTLTYAWTQVSGPTVTLAGANTAKASFTAATAGTYGFKLSVGDGKASSDSSVQVTVNAAVPAGPYLALASPATWQVGKAQLITFTGNQLKPSQQIVIQFSKNGGRKFKTLKTLALKKGGLKWKPAKAHQTPQGVLRAYAKYDKKQPVLYSDPVNIVVEPKAKK
jgi:hypothetical protein